ncbi:putative N-formylglutamate amidohydrolase [Yoonia maricola]|uniref:Putative N-formylglutamate amidohydrolase n=1 Tax=Yoonia maricola TaxID=420999 RepID=A0A2M8WNZ1_9RHOB|nr:N-formylglutamate amidohydrolase [Yoonia maricola]PJI92649.1 putative N-formylglutamate amidohydrolase [Yoonia maricola]
MDLHQDDSRVVEVSRSRARSAIVLVCEHASFHIPEDLNNLGISIAAKRSHVAWDPGAIAVAQRMSKDLDAVLVASTVSRLVYDCNRPPEATDAIPTRSEIYDVPGNVGLTDNEKRARVARYYAPFREKLASEIARRTNPVIVTVHSFTPNYNGETREVEIGILHDRDSALADAVMQVASGHVVRRNDPYGPKDGVTHTLKEHALKHGHLNVMIEVRNDLIADETTQTAMAKTLTGWITQALETLGADACKA